MALHRGASRLGNIFTLNTVDSMLVLTHMNPHIARPLEKGLADIGRIYNGQVVFAEKLLRLELRRSSGR